MNKEQTIKEITEIFVMQEEAIKSHEQKLIELYETSKNVMLAGQRAEWNVELPDTIHPSSSEVEIANKYIVSSSFISAWYHIMKDEKRRDSLAHSCSNLISGIGISSEEVFYKYLQTEALWRNQMNKVGIRNNRNIKATMIIIAIIALVYFGFKFL